MGSGRALLQGDRGAARLAANPPPRLLHKYGTIRRRDRRQGRVQAVLHGSRRLHANFYNDYMSAEQVGESIEDTRKFIGMLDDIEADATETRPR